MVCQELPICELLQQQDDHNYKIIPLSVLTSNEYTFIPKHENKKSNTSIKSTHNSLQNDIHVSTYICILSQRAVLKYYFEKI